MCAQSLISCFLWDSPHNFEIYLLLNLNSKDRVYELVLTPLFLPSLCTSSRSLPIFYSLIDSIFLKKKKKTNQLAFFPYFSDAYLCITNMSVSFMHKVVYDSVVRKRELLKRTIFLTNLEEEEE
jgi:hypothetical protein